jgi:hypothetical protein
MKLIPALIFICFAWSAGYCQKMDFYSESLTFRLQHGQFELDGLYYFRNNTQTELRQVLFYPFPDTEKYGDISYISITPKNDTTSLLIKQTDKGALFMVHLAPGQESAYHIIYRQNLASNQAKYIILTTQKWGKPFNKADYRLEVPEPIRLTNISIEPDSTFFKENQQIYIWQRKNFMPSVDFEFTFE